MALTLRLPPELDEALRAAAVEDRRSVQQEIVVALEAYLAGRETDDIKADPEALRSLADAREAVRAGDVVYGTDAARALVSQRADR